MGGRGSSGSGGGGLSKQENEVLDRYQELFDYGEFSRNEAVLSVEDNGSFVTITMKDGSIFEIADLGDAKRDISDQLYKDTDGWGFGGMSDNGDTAVINYKDGSYALLGYDYLPKKPKLTGIRSAVTTNDTTTVIYGKPGKIRFENWTEGKRTNRQAYNDMAYSWRLDY